MSFCAAFKCFTGLKKSMKNVKLFSFPKDPKLCEQWVTGFCRKGYKAGPTSRLCANHFTSDCFFDADCRILLPDAIPTLNSRNTEEVPTFHNCDRLLDVITYIEDVPPAPKRLEGYCRVCARVNEALTPIYEDQEGSSHGLEQVINKHLPIMVSKNDLLPLMVCQACSLTIAEFVKLHEECLEAQQTLTSVLEFQNLKTLSNRTRDANSNTGDMDTDDTWPRRKGRRSRWTRLYADIIPEDIVEMPDDPDSKALVECPRCLFYFLDDSLQAHLAECKEKHNLLHETDVRDKKPKKKKWSIDIKPLVRHLENHAPGNVNNEKSAKINMKKSVKETDYDRFIVKRLENYPCGNCMKVYKNEHMLKRHILHDCGSSDSFICATCGRRFRRSYNLSRHQLTHNPDNKGFACQQCPKRFNVKGALKVHMRSHSVERPYKCDLCGKRFKVKRSLLRHKNTLHPPNCNWVDDFEKDNDQPGENTVPTNEQSLQMEVPGDGKLIITNEEQYLYSCYMCGIEFNNQKLLQCHFSSQHYECRYCEQLFAHKKMLRKHEREHEEKISLAS